MDGGSRVGGVLDGCGLRPEYASDHCGTGFARGSCGSAHIRARCIVGRPRSALERLASEVPQWVLAPRDQALVDAHHTRRANSLRRHLALLQRSGDARSQLDYALLSGMHDASRGTDPVSIRAWMARRDQAIARAGTADPDDPIAAWMEAVVCGDPALCDKAAARRRLQRVAPDDLLSWMLELDDPGLSHAQVDAVLARMAASPRVALHDRNTLRVYDGLRRAGLPAPNEHLRSLLARDPYLTGPMSNEARDYTQAFGVSVTALPWVQGVSNACRGSMTMARHAACMQVMTRLSDSGSMLFEAVGNRRMMKLTEGTPAYADWVARDRQHEWRMASVDIQWDVRFSRCACA